MQYNIKLAAEKPLHLVNLVTGIVNESSMHFHIGVEDDVHFL